MQVWVRNGLIAGGIAGVVTIIVNLAERAMATGDVCHRTGPRLGYLGFVAFLLLTGWAGYATARAGLSVSRAAIAGVIGGAVSGIGTIIVVLSALDQIRSASQCIANPNGVDVQAFATAGGVIAALVLFIIGIAIAAGAAAVGGVLGQRPASTR
ncbi:MAG TPA: hypothetical protein VET65_13020 [Candidatus Limnocylindrales bacterium]|nr:hypothetical protein [Candidatus Limnocylindrales bacterium]